MKIEILLLVRVNIERKNENELLIMKMEIFNWKELVKMDRKIENELIIMKMEILN